MAMNNKGFSLIELIIVIAIMAILVAIIAPNLTKYLSESKRQTDNRNIDEVRHQVVNCISEAATKNVDVIDTSSGATEAYYRLEYDSATDKTKAVSVTDGTSKFAEVLSASLDEANTASSKDKTKTKMEIKIFKNAIGGYDVKVGYTS